MAIHAELSCFRGEDVTLAITIIDAAEAAVDITAYTFDFRAKERFAADPVIDVAGAAIVIQDAEAGEVNVTLTAADTDIEPNVYEWQLFRNDDGSNAVLAYGSLYVRRGLVTAEEGS